MAAYRRVYDSHHLQVDCQEPRSTPEPHDWQSSMGYLYRILPWEGAPWGTYLGMPRHAGSRCTSHTYSALFARGQQRCGLLTTSTVAACYCTALCTDDQVVQSSSERCRVLVLHMLHQRTGVSALPGLRAFPRLSAGAERALLIVGGVVVGGPGPADSSEMEMNVLAVSLQRPTHRSTGS